MNKKIFIYTELLIYLIFIVFDCFSKESTYIKYLGILLCLVFALSNKSHELSIAMLFTVLADTFLLVINNYYVVGLLFFICVQLTYLKYLTKHSNYKKFLFLRIIVFVIGVLVLYKVNYFDLLNLLVIFYFSNLLVNTIQSYTTDLFKLKLGLTLFVCCDICVGLHNILGFSILYQLVSFLMWIFYLPSQVLISLNFLETK